MSGCPLLEATSDLLGYDALPVARIHRLLSMPPTNPNPKTRIELNSAISVPCLT
jgi:hypothetical protein